MCRSAGERLVVERAAAAAGAGRCARSPPLMHIHTVAEQAKRSHGARSMNEVGLTFPQPKRTFLPYSSAFRRAAQLGYVVPQRRVKQCVALLAANDSRCFEKSLLIH